MKETKKGNNTSYGNNFEWTYDQMWNIFPVNVKERMVEIANEEIVRDILDNIR